MNLQLKLVLQAVDRITAPVKKIAEATENLSKVTRIAGQSAATASAGQDKLEHSVTRSAHSTASAAPLVTRLASLNERLGLSSRRAAADLERESEAAGRTRAHVEGLGGALGGVTNRLSGMGGLLGAVTRIGGVVGAIVAGATTLSGIKLLGGVIDTSAQFEGYRELLVTLEGSEAAARKSLAWVTAFAQRTPESIDEVMKAYVKLRSYGIDPTKGAMEKLGNAAAVFKPMGKSLDDVVEALADAQQGEFERLKEFGIKASAKGKDITLSYVKGQKEIVVHTQKSALEIQKAVLGIFDQRYAGAMDRQARTWAGMMSMIRDTWTNFKLAIGDAGIFDLLKSKLQLFLNKLNELSRTGQLKLFATKISDAFSLVVNAVSDFIMKTDWNAVGKVIKDTFNSIDWKGIGYFMLYLAKALGKVGEGIAFLGRMSERYHVSIAGTLMDSLPGIGQARQLRRFAGALLDGAEDSTAKPRAGSAPRSLAPWAAPRALGPPASVRQPAGPAQSQGPWSRDSRHVIEVRAEPGTQARVRPDRASPFDWSTSHRGPALAPR